MFDDSPYLAFNALRNLSRVVNSFLPVWYSQYFLSIGQRLSSGSIFLSDASGGISSPGQVSVLNPHAPPRVVSVNQ